MNWLLTVLQSIWADPVVQTAAIGLLKEFEEWFLKKYGALPTLGMTSQHDGHRLWAEFKADTGKP